MEGVADNILHSLCFKANGSQKGFNNASAVARWREEVPDDLSLGVDAEVAVNVPLVNCDGVSRDPHVVGDGFAGEAQFEAEHEALPQGG